MSEHMALQQAARDYDVLRQAVRDFLDQYHDDDVSGERPSWPTQLVTLVDWKAPEDES